MDLAVAKRQIEEVNAESGAGLSLVEGKVRCPYCAEKGQECTVSAPDNLATSQRDRGRFKDRLQHHVVSRP